MEVPILYYDELNPQSRSCLMVVKILNLNVNLCPAEESMPPYSPQPQTMQTAPTLIHYGLVLRDSHSILIYLCEFCRSEYSMQLYPCDFQSRMRVIDKLFFENNVLFQRYSDFMTDVVRQTLAHTDVAYHETKIVEAYDMMESFLLETKFMAGYTITIADISFCATVCSLDLMFPIAQGPITRWNNLLCWFNFMRTLPVFCLNFNGMEKQRAIIDSMTKLDSDGSAKNNGKSSDNLAHGNNHWERDSTTQGNNLESACKSEIYPSGSKSHDLPNIDHLTLNAKEKGSFVIPSLQGLMRSPPTMPTTRTEQLLELNLSSTSTSTSTSPSQATHRQQGQQKLDSEDDFDDRTYFKEQPDRGVGNMSKYWRDSYEMGMLRTTDCNDAAGSISTKKCNVHSNTQRRTRDLIPSSYRQTDEYFDDDGTMSPSSGSEPQKNSSTSTSNGLRNSRQSPARLLAGLGAADDDDLKLLGVLAGMRRFRGFDRLGKEDRKNGECCQHQIRGAKYGLNADQLDDFRSSGCSSAAATGAFIRESVTNERNFDGGCSSGEDMRRNDGAQCPPHCTKQKKKRTSWKEELEETSSFTCSCIDPSKNITPNDEASSAQDKSDSDRDNELYGPIYKTPPVEIPGELAFNNLQPYQAEQRDDNDISVELFGDTCPFSINKSSGGLTPLLPHWMNATENDYYSTGVTGANCLLRIKESRDASQNTDPPKAEIKCSIQHPQQGKGEVAQAVLQVQLVDKGSVNMFSEQANGRTTTQTTTQHHIEKTTTGPDKISIISMKEHPFFASGSSMIGNLMQKDAAKPECCDAPPLDDSLGGPEECCEDFSKSKDIIVFLKGDERYVCDMAEADVVKTEIAPKTRSTGVSIVISQHKVNDGTQEHIVVAEKVEKFEHVAAGDEKKTRTSAVRVSRLPKRQDQTRLVEKELPASRASSPGIVLSERSAPAVCDSLELGNSNLCQLSSERVSVRASEQVSELPPERPPELPSERVSGVPSERALERPSQRPSERASERVSERAILKKKSSIKAPASATATATATASVSGTTFTSTPDKSLQGKYMSAPLRPGSKQTLSEDRRTKPKSISKNTSSRIITMGTPESKKLGVRKAPTK